MLTVELPKENGVVTVQVKDANEARELALKLLAAAIREEETV